MNEFGLSSFVIAFNFEISLFFFFFFTQMRLLRRHTVLEYVDMENSARRVNFSRECQYYPRVVPYLTVSLRVEV